MSKEELKEEFFLALWLSALGVLLVYLDSLTHTGFSFLIIAAILLGWASVIKHWLDEKEREEASEK